MEARSRSKERVGNGANTATLDISQQRIDFLKTIVDEKIAVMAERAPKAYPDDVQIQKEAKAVLDAIPAFKNGSDTRRFLEAYSNFRNTVKKVAHRVSKQFVFEYIDEEGLDGVFENYHYAGSDLSILAPYLQYWWRFAVEFLPMTLAPNMVTMLGFFFIIASYLCTVFMDPNYTSDVPRWVYLFHAFCLFIYQTMDALDGKQARRTGNSTPLGELFDHGCDAVTTSLATLTAFSTIGFGTSFGLVVAMLLNLTLFYLAQWEEYQSGVLELGYINVTEAQCLLMGIHLLTYFLGATWWLNSFTIGGFTIFYNYIPLIFLFVSFIGTAVVNFKNVAGFVKTKKLNAAHVYGQLVPIILCDISFYLWTTRTEIVRTHPNQVLLGYGLIMAVMVGKVVLARVCSMHFSSFQPATVVLLIAGINSFAQILPQSFMANFVLVGGIACYLHLANYVIQVLCSNLCIYAFQIIPRATK